MAPDAPAWHSLSVEQCASRVDTEPAHGLTDAEAEGRLAHTGPNTLPEAVQSPWWKALAREFANPLTAVLAVAVVLTVYLGDYVDSVVIGVVIVINSLIGFIQEFRAEAALRAVSRLLSPTCVVIRDGHPLTVASSEVVPGDVVALAAGDRTPADMRLMAVDSLEVDESALTGESMPVAKTVDEGPADAPIAERHSMAFAGSVVTRGSGRGIVIATGSQTELGLIGQMMRRVERLRTPLTKRLDTLARQITLAVLVISSVIVAWGMVARQWEFDFLFVAVVGLAVGAIPEGLPAVITFALASSAKRLTELGVLVRRLPAVEALGSVTVVFTDKTGTLTRNEMTVVELDTPDHHLEVTGVGYQSEGHILGFDVDDHSDIGQALAVFALCNDASIGPSTETGRLTGDPTELALLSVASKVGLDVPHFRAQQPRIATIPFDSEQQYMATLHHEPDGHLLAVKGSPEAVLELCRSNLSAEELRRWQILAEEHAQRGHRVLLAATSTKPSIELSELTAQELKPVGLAALIDPPREEAAGAVAECVRAGVRVVMVTGDHPDTARSIARGLGFPDRTPLAGSDIDALSDEELQRRLADTVVVARATPSHKLRLVQLAQAQGDFVAMTGDGVNDAPALRQADIGVAMGKNGTDVAKEAADIVITDDRFATISTAIREGRRVFDNIKKSLLFLLSTDVDEAVLIILAILFGVSLPVTPTQILWVNLVTSITLSFALVAERAEKSVMTRGPNPRSLSLISPAMLARILFVSALSVAATFGVFRWYLDQGVSLEYAQTASVTMLVVVEVAILLNHRRFVDSAVAPSALLRNKVVWLVLPPLAIMQIGFVYLPAMHSVFGSTPLSIGTWMVVLGASGVIFALVEVEKWVRRRRGQVGF
jgi:magnesium-transporting ATPase (P-type)